MKTEKERKEAKRLYDKANRERFATRRRAYSRTPHGLVSDVYSTQASHSTFRGHPKPTYTREQLRAWMFKQPAFKQLFDRWVCSGYVKWGRPSCDRLDDSKPYSLDNIRLVSWKENHKKSSEDQRGGKLCADTVTPVLRISQGGEVKQYISQKEAARQNGLLQAHISSCCRGLRTTHGGFKWRFVNER